MRFATLAIRVTKKSVGGKQWLRSWIKSFLFQKEGPLKKKECYSWMTSRCNDDIPMCSV